MCFVSAVAQRWTDDRWPQFIPTVTYTPQPQQWAVIDSVPRVEFEALKAELEALKKLLVAAKVFDRETGQPDCEQEEKVALFKKLAKALDVDLSEVFP